MIEQFFIDTLKDYGIAGAAILALGYSTIKLYIRNQELSDALTKFGMESVQSNLSVSAALTSMSEVNRQTNASIQTLSASTQSLDGSVRQVLVMGSRSNGRRSNEG